MMVGWTQLGFVIIWNNFVIKYGDGHWRGLLFRWNDGMVMFQQLHITTNTTINNIMVSTWCNVVYSSYIDIIGDG